MLAEATLTWCEVPFRIEDVDGFDRPGASRERLLSLNPLAQVPTPVLPDGRVMTESAAIALDLAEEPPVAGLAPSPGDSTRPLFLRCLIWLVADVYPTFTYGDYPERWTSADLRPAECNSRAPREPLAATGGRDRIGPMGAGRTALGAGHLCWGHDPLAPAPRLVQNELSAARRDRPTSGRATKAQARVEQEFPTRGCFGSIVISVKHCQSLTVWSIGRQVPAARADRGPGAPR